MMKIGDSVKVVKLYSILGKPPKHYYGKVGIVTAINGSEISVDFGDEVRIMPMEVLKKGSR